MMHFLQILALGGTFILILPLGKGRKTEVYFQIAACLLVFLELVETLWTLGKNGPLYDLIRVLTNFPVFIGFTTYIKAL
jgi:hypothetical protein